jgi:hypothetical protein
MRSHLAGRKGVGKTLVFPWRKESENRGFSRSRVAPTFLLTSLAVGLMICTGNSGAQKMEHHPHYFVIKNPDGTTQPICRLTPSESARVITDCGRLVKIDDGQFVIWGYPYQNPDELLPEYFIEVVPHERGACTEHLKEGRT